MTKIKKTHWLRNTLIVLIICGILGCGLAAVLFFRENNRNYASASLLFAFDGAAEGKAPNGYAFDVSGLTADEVLNEALEAAGLSGTYTAEQIRENLSVTGIYPETIAAQMTRYVSLLDGDANTQAAIQDYHATQYNIVLYSDFDRGISSAKLLELLRDILSAYRGYFAKTYAVSLSTEELISDLSNYDYAQQLEAVNETVTQEIRYAQELEELAPDFLLNRKSFGDISVRFSSLQNDINRLNATIILNAVSRDQDRLKKRYEMEIREQKLNLESWTEELAKIEEQVQTYDKDGIVYVSSNGTLESVGSNSSATYDTLVRKRKSVSDSIAKANATISLYQARLEDMASVASKSSEKTQTTENHEEETEEIDVEAAAAIEALTEEERALLRETVERQIQSLLTKQESIEQEFLEMLEAYTAQEINEKTVIASNIKYKAPSVISGAFIVKAIKTAGPICAIGFMVCMVLLIASRKKEEKVIG